MENEPIHTTAPYATTPDDLAAAAALLQAGKIVAFPTETVYGLGADAFNPVAVRRIFDLKGRPADHPLILHLADVAQLERVARQIPAAAYLLAEQCWPGPLTLILHRRPDVPDLVTGGQDTVGVRIPAHPVALSLLSAFGGPVAAPSANRFGKISPTTAEHVRLELGDGPDLILEGGASAVGLESTILDLTGQQPVVLRPGAVVPEQLAELLGQQVVVGGAADHKVRVSGMLPSHYAPGAPLQLLPVAELPAAVARCLQEGKRVAVMAPETACGTGLQGCRLAVMPTSPAAYARLLYATLRQLDAANPAVILVAAPPESPPWLAINDRLKRAAASSHRTEPGAASTEERGIFP